MRILVFAIATALLSCAHPAVPAPAAPSRPAISASSSSTGAFACGGATCDAGREYCEMIKTDDLRLPSTYTCRPLPTSCAAASACGCFPAATRCDYCARLDGGGVAHFQRTCVGGR